MPTSLTPALIQLLITFLQQLLVLLQDKRPAQDEEAPPTTSTYEETSLTIFTPVEEITTTSSPEKPLFGFPTRSPSPVYELPSCSYCRKPVYDKDTSHCWNHLLRDELRHRGIPSPQTPKERHPSAPRNNRSLFS